MIDKPDLDRLFETPTITFYNRPWRSFVTTAASRRCDGSFNCDVFILPDDNKNETLIAKSDVVVFAPWTDHQLKFSDIEFFYDWINNLRHQQQLFLFFQMESPFHVQLPYMKFNNFFNATISYLGDANQR